MKEKVVIKKCLTGILTAAFMITSIPYAVFAEEIVDEEVVTVEEETVYADADDNNVSQMVYSGGTEDNPEEIKIPDDLNKDFHVKQTDDSESFYFKFELKKAGVMTFHFEDDSKEDWSWSQFAISNTPHPSNTDPRSSFYLKMKTHDEQNYAAIGCYVTWLDNNVDTCLIGFIPGTYYIWVYPDSNLTFTFNIKDFAELEPAGSDEELLVDDKLGGTDHGTNDYYDFLDVGPGGQYKNKPMPEIKLNQKYRGILTNDSREDYYHFVLEKDSPLFLSAASDQIGELYVEMYYVEQFGEGDPYVTIMVMSPEFDKEGCGHTHSNYSKTISINEYQLKNRLSVNHNQDSPIFKAGEYAIRFRGERSGPSQRDRLKGEQGIYSFILATGKATPVTGLKCEPQGLTLSSGDTKTFKTVVAPADAQNTGVKISKVEPEGVIEVTKAKDAEVKPGETVFNVKAIGNGTATITIETEGTDKSGKPLTATCTVSVAEAKNDCPAVVTKQKINLLDDDYFGKDTKIDPKKEKFVVIDPDTEKTSKLGSVTKAGIFTANKPGKVIVRKVMQADKKTLITTGQVSFTIETPQYQKDKSGKTPKDIKTVSVFKKGDVIDPSEYIFCNEESGITPSSVTISDKKGYFTYDEETGLITVNNSGTCKVTVSFGKNDKVSGTKAAAYSFTIKSALPTMKDGKVAPGKSVTIAVSKVPRDYKITADDWSIREVSLKGEEGSADPVSAFTINPVAKKKYMACEVSADPSAAKGVQAELVCTIDGVEYVSMITVK